MREVVLHADMSCKSFDKLQFCWTHHCMVNKHMPMHCSLELVHCSVNVTDLQK